MELSALESYGEPGAVVYRTECVDLMRLMPAESVEVIFADPPYRLSGGGVSVRSGYLVPVDKGGWDRPMGLRTHHSAYSCSSQKSWTKYGHPLVRERSSGIRPGGVMQHSG